jgi:hypothetical protein
MRYFRALAGGLGASGSLVVAAAVLVGVLSAGLAFHGWPDLGRDDRGSAPLSQLPDARARSAARAVEALPVVAPAAADVRRTRSAAANRARRSASSRHTARTGETTRRASALRRPSFTPSTGARPTAPAPSGGGSSPSKDPAQPASATPTGGGGASTPAIPAPPSVPPAPSLPPAPSPPAPPDPGEAVGDIAGAVGGAASQTTSSLADAVRPVAPSLADTVDQSGQGLGDAVGQTGQAVGDLVGGLLGGGKPKK